MNGKSFLSELVLEAEDINRSELMQKMNSIRVGEEVDFTPQEASVLNIQDDYELEALWLAEQN